MKHTPTDPPRDNNLMQQVQLALAQSERDRKPRSFIAIDGLFVEVNVNGRTTLTIWRRRASDLTDRDWRRFADVWPYPHVLPAPDKQRVEDKRTSVLRTVWTASWPTPPRLLDADVSTEEVTR